MNFLSHYYFDQQETDSHLVIGIVLPDFIKNAHKDWNLNPQKEEHLFLDFPREAAILKGWKRHLEVDRLFHGSDFFTSQTAELKQLMMPAMQTGPVKPFFLAHIGLELILDHLLTTKNQVNINQFYIQLNEANSDSLQSFLMKAGVNDMDLFMKFLDGFISSRYLLSYQKIENITYALNRICMRLWHEPFTLEQLEQLTESLIIYRDTITPDYMNIYKEIEKKL
ncbi:acyl carrier protein phosphodiesterase [Pedobacter sp. CG_S7]|uniref:ACP phosphodiesterase n=1 Tax=Pedobacter sp. CG_S7 TaxID=3143930 RepID=UPI003392247A